jgi:hypothetical protein
MEDSDSDADADAGAGADTDVAMLPAVQPRKRKEQPTQLSSARPKRVHTSPDGEPRPVVTVTNNNRRSDLRIQTKIGKAHEKQKANLGLLPPLTHASTAEKQAYHAIPPADVQHIS